MESAYTFQAITLVSILFQIVCYIFLSLRLRSWFSFVSLPLLSNIVSNGVLPYLGLFAAGPNGSLFAYTFCQLTYSAMAAGMLLAVYLPTPRLRSLRFLGRTDEYFGTEYSRAVAWGFLISAIVVFSPILIAFRGSLSDPRYIYEQTRTGYGLNYFLSTTLTIMAWVSHLFARRKWWETTIFFLICAELVYLHGSKGQVVSLMTVYVLYRVYVLRKAITIKQFVPLSIAGGVVVAALIISFSYNTVNLANLTEWAVGYSDYTRNAMIVIDDPGLFDAPRYGQIALENEFYSRIPRLLDPNKPKDFGSFRLAAIYYPANFESDGGTVSFGIGVQYADFVIFALPLLLLWTIGTTWLTRGVVSHVQATPTPGLFLLLAFLSGITLIPSGVGYTLPEAILLGYGTNLAFKYWRSLRKLVLGGQPIHAEPLPALRATGTSAE